MTKQLTFFPARRSTMDAAPSRTTTPTTRNNEWEIFVDGASRGNPGEAGAGIFVRKDDHEIVREGIYLGKRTNNQAEYLALALALYYVKKTIADRKIKKPILKINSDSELLIKQMRGLYKVRNPQLAQLKALIDSQLQNLNYTFRHVRREKNEIADSLANKGIDKKKKMPSAFSKMLEDKR